MTNFSEEYESQKEDLYEETVEKYRNFDRSMGYDLFYDEKERLLESLKSEYFKEVDQITAAWK